MCMWLGKLYGRTMCAWGKFFEVGQWVFLGRGDSIFEVCRDVFWGVGLMCIVQWVMLLEGIGSRGFKWRC